MAVWTSTRRRPAFRKSAIAVPISSLPIPLPRNLGSTKNFCSFRCGLVEQVERHHASSSAVEPRKHDAGVLRAEGGGEAFAGVAVERGDELLAG